MSTAPHSTLHAPPLPRYRYHAKTGVWRKERVADGGVCGGTARNAATTAVPAALEGASSKPFESSFDYFLRSARPPAHRISAAEREELRRQRTNAKLHEFENSLQTHRVATTTRELHSSAGVSHRGSAQNDDRIGLGSSEASGALHPLVGYASTVSLPAVYTALMRVVGHALSFTVAGQEDLLSRQSFQELLALLGPVEVLSDEYVSTIFTSLPSYNAFTDTADALAIFTLLIEYRHHPRLDSNLAALFEAFDTDDKGVVPAEVLSPDVLLAWAAQHTFGNLRDQWQRFAAVIRKEKECDPERLPLLPPLASRTAIRAALCSVDAIYAAACSLDLNGDSL
ncbi:hypothetical protein JKF63_05162 [Porcisia hertigi]|uniref:EF-hand domain-containing protein n=1 Tax=Porcisia hertigi TaxID=2761500 RepID=A0A836ITD3_9TRYP|nr:hypothetical protein JKF63_05162 [Porcisia hertigi]